MDWEDPLEKGAGKLLQYSCLQNLQGQEEPIDYSQ